MIQDRVFRTHQEPAARWHNRVLDPRDLPAAEQEALWRELWRVHQRIFSGVNEQQLRDFLLDNGSDFIRLYMVGHAGEAVGYMVFNSYICQPSQGRTWVHRVATGLFPGSRLRGAVQHFLFRTICEIRLRDPFSHQCLLATLVHPSSYCAMANGFPVIWPSPTRPTPAADEALMLELADMLGLPRIEGLEARYRACMWQVEHESRSRRTTPAGTFFEDLRPPDSAGVGVLTMVPMTPYNLAGMVWNHSRRMLVTALRRP